METEIAQALSNVNINSETAQIVMAEYMRYKYIKLATALFIFTPILWGLCFVCWRLVKNDLDW